MGVHSNTLHHWINGGQLTCLKANGVIRIRDKDIAELNRRCEFDAAKCESGDAVISLTPKASNDAFEMGVAA